MSKIILIGGGEIRDKETLLIDQEFLRLSGSKKAVIGFFPTAAGDSDGYIESFTNYYQSLGCQKIIPIKLSELPSGEYQELISQMTGIYLSGGATSALIENFKKKGVDKLVKKKLDDGLVLAGMSAGALAACDYYIDPDIKPEKQKIEKGLGFQHSVLCVVHYNERKDKHIVSRLKKDLPEYKVFGIPEKRAILINGEEIKWLG